MRVLLLLLLLDDAVADTPEAFAVADDESPYCESTTSSFFLVACSACVSRGGS